MCVCVICAFLCEVLRVTGMSVVEHVEVAVKMMIMVKKDDEEEDSRILRWLTVAGY